MSPPGIVAAGILLFAVGLVVAMLLAFGWGDPPFGWYTA